ncbi:MAG: hypothetical protein PHI29_05470 [Gallionella sp.]|nr:hypothetical protein [Gallionella sp.]
MKKAETYVKFNQEALDGLRSANFYALTEKEAVQSMTDEFNGDAARAQATFRYYADLPANQDALRSQLYEIIQRLRGMEQVRKQTNYVALVKAQGESNERMKQAAIANTDRLQNALDNNANFYNALGSGPDIIRSKDSRGSYQDEVTYKGRVREQTIASQKRAEEDLMRGQAEVERERREAEQNQRVFLQQNQSLPEVKKYISTESDLISEKLWPALKKTLANLDQMLAAAKAN